MGIQQIPGINAQLPIGLWVPWSPTLTNLTLGNGTLSARFRGVGKTTIDYRFVFTLGSTSIVGTDPGFSLPITPHADYYSNAVIGNGQLYDNGTNGFSAEIWVTTLPNVRFLSIDTSGTRAQGSNVTSTSPFTWVAGDILLATGSYEPA